MTLDAHEPRSLPPSAHAGLRPRVVILIGNAGFAAVWWGMMPGGFPVGHARFWANRAAPALLLAVAVLGLWFAFSRRHDALRCVILGLAGMWLAAAVSAVVVFPVSGWRLGVVPFLVAVVAARRGLQPKGGRQRWPVLAVAAGVALGVALPWTQRAAEPATRPLNVSIAFPDDDADFTSQSHARLAPGVTVDTLAGQIDLQRGQYELSVNPLLTFISRSPDRSWTIAAPRRARLGPGRRLDESGVSAHAPSWLATTRTTPSTFSSGRCLTTRTRRRNPARG